MHQRILEMNLDLSNNYKLNYKNIFGFINELESLKNVKKLVLNVTNVNISPI